MSVIDFNKWGNTATKPVESTIEGFMDAMREHGLGVSSVVPDGKLHRFTIDGDKAKSLNGWYVLHEDISFSAGAFGNWKTGDMHKWCSVSENAMTSSEKDEFRRRMEELQAARRAEEERVQAECREWCGKHWAKAEPAPYDHPYLHRKGIKSHGVKLYKDSLMVPVRDVDGTIHGMQFIKTDGEKKFKTGSKMRGGFYSIMGQGKIVLCEGFATAASIHEATGYNAVVAFNAGNLFDVAKIVKPDYVAADNDHKTTGNPGLSYGKQAADAVGAKLVYPNGISGTDFNDLYMEQGITAVAAYFLPPKAAKFKSMSDLIDCEFDPIRWAVEGLLPEGLAVLSGPPKLGKSWLSLDFCLNIAIGGMCAGHFPSEQGTVLLCAMEDNERRLKSRLKMRLGSSFRFPIIGPLDFNEVKDPVLDKFFYTTSLPVLDMGGMDYIKEFLDAHPDCKLIVLDTLAKVKPESKGKGNAYENDYKDLGELQRLALDRNCCILVITHNRKTETDDALQSISGSTGITGVMDTILILKRARGGSAATMMVTGRDVSEHTWAMQFDGEHGAWTVSGEAETDVKRGQDAPLQEEVLQVLQRVFLETGRGLKLQELYEEMGGSTLAPAKSNISRSLNKLDTRGDVYKSGGYWIPKEYGGGEK